MAATDGVEVVGTYPSAGVTTGLANAQANIDALLALVPNPEVAPAQAGGGFLDEMSSAAAIQLRVELAALRASLA